MEQLSLLDLLGSLEEAAERATRTLRNGLMLEVTDPEQIRQHHKDWKAVNPWPKRAPFYGFTHPVWESMKSANGHEWAEFLSDTRCVCGIGYKNGPRIHDCLCVGGWYRRIYCYSCQWWGEVFQLSTEADASTRGHFDTPNPNIIAA